MMPTGDVPASERATIFCLHYLGGSAREWTWVAERLAAELRCIALDLPGFGDAAHVTGYDVAAMAAYVAQAVRTEAPARWFLAGHSMGAKVATVVARSAENGAPGLDGLMGIVLLAGSPPAPEPMPADQRKQMLSWFTDGPQQDRRQARAYIAANSGPALGEQDADNAAADVVRANHAAWVGWLESGSREDWSDRVGVLRTPALIVAGADDTNLGADAQRDLMAPHFAGVKQVTLPNTRHLLPLERPDDVARVIREHVAAVGNGADAGRNSDAFRDLTQSIRVSRRTREVLSERGSPDDSAYAPVALTVEAFGVLRTLLARVVPQTAGHRIDLAARIDAQLAAEAGDGWRFAVLPPDLPAYHAALATVRDEAQHVYGDNINALDGAQVDRLLTRIAAGRLGAVEADAAAPAAGRLSALQMRAWFEDMRADAVKEYMAHPATLARIGYSGFANGGDGEPKSGFVRIGAGEREAWEPVARPESAL